MKSLCLAILCLAIVVEGGGAKGKGKGNGFRQPSCTIDGVIVPAGVTQRVGCRFCFCDFDGNPDCTTFGDEAECETPKCSAPFIPNGKCCPVCPSEETPEFPSLSGSGNNIATPSRGAVGTRLLRFAPPAYADGYSSPREDSTNTLPSARNVSQNMSDQDGDKHDPRGLTAWVWQWGQFLDHDITLVTELVEHAENFDIPVTDCDLKDLNPSCAATSIHFQRANWARETGTGPTNFRQHVNSISTFVDGSNVYGSDYFTDTKLRTGEGGKLKVHTSVDAENGELMPSNLVEGITMAALDGSAEHFAAGDIRANEQQLLTTLHTLWVREHNRWATKISSEHSWDDERVFQQARKFVIAQMQIITFDEWLPSLLGSSLPRYTGYQPTIEPGLTTEFVGAFYRFGHSMIRGDYPHLSANLDDTVTNERITLEQLFFNSDFFFDGTHSVNGFARGLSATRAQGIDVYAVDGLRNKLFDLPIDLVALNVQRGRDLGIPSLNDVRRALGLEPHAALSDISTDATVQSRLANTYNDVEQVDPWIGALAEDPFYGSVGETLGTVLIDQFTRLRDGDRFFWLNWLNEAEQAEVSGFTLQQLLVNTGMTELGSAEVGTTNLFFCQQSALFGNSMPEQCDVTCTGSEPTNCVNANGDVIGLTYPNPNDSCQPYACPCEACDDTQENKVCGSDGHTYHNICELEQAQCSARSLRFLHTGPCFEDVVTYFAGEDLEIYQSTHGGPLLLEGKLHEGKGKGAGREYQVNFVDNCHDKNQLNPFASPKFPIPPVATVNTDNNGNVEKVLSEEVIVNDVGTLSWLGGVERCTVGTGEHSILNKAILFQHVDGSTDDLCYSIEGPPFVVMTAELKKSNQGTADVVLVSAIQGGEANIQITVAASGSGPTLTSGKYELRLSPDDCGNNNPGIMNYAVPPGEYGVPPVAEFTLHVGAIEETFQYVNDKLKLIGSKTPMKKFLRLVRLNDADGILEGCGEVVLQEEPDSCVLDNTANGGKGGGKGEGKGGGQNLQESTTVAQGDKHESNTAVYGNQTEGGMQSFLQSSSGVILLCALVVILTVALVFVVIVAYVRSNPYTAPAALKRVASVTGDPRPTAGA